MVVVRDAGRPFRLVRRVPLDAVCTRCGRRIRTRVAWPRCSGCGCRRVVVTQSELTPGGSAQESLL